MFDGIKSCVPRRGGCKVYQGQQEVVMLEKGVDKAEYAGPEEVAANRLVALKMLENLRRSKTDLSAEGMRGAWRGE